MGRWDDDDSTWAARFATMGEEPKAYLDPRLLPEVVRGRTVLALVGSAGEPSRLWLTAGREGLWESRTIHHRHVAQQGTATVTHYNESGLLVGNLDVQRWSLLPKSNVKCRGCSGGGIVTSPDHVVPIPCPACKGEGHMRAGPPPGSKPKSPFEF